MNKDLQQILIDIFPLIVEVNFNTVYRANIDIQPTFFGDHQIWYRVSNDAKQYMYFKTAFWDKEERFKQRMAEFKNELLKILGRG